MREIKFRARNAEVPRCWIYGYFVIEQGCYYIINDDGKFKVIADTQSQYTGLKDKNGKEIYEGDIVKKTMKRGYMLDRKVGQIKYIHDCFQVRYEGGMTDIIPAWLEVIGNVYENKSLLKEEK